MGVMCSREGTALLGSCPGAEGAPSALPRGNLLPGSRKSGMTQSLGWKQHHLLRSGLSFLRAAAFQGMLHNHLRNTLTWAPPSRAEMLPERQRSLGTTDPSRGCSSRISSLFQPPSPGVSEQGRAGVSGGGGLLTPRARSCGCASCSTFLRLRLRLPPGACGWGGGFPVVPMPRVRANTQDNAQQPPQPPESPSEHPGDGAARRSSAQGLCKTSSQALALLILPAC